MFVTRNNFIADFKLSDNISYNFAILKLLYEAYDGDENSETRRYLRKPITVTLVSIIEAILHDFHIRARTFTREGIAKIPHEVISYIRGKQIEDFEKYIASARKHDLFETQGHSLYNALDELRKLRNRVHIQNKHNELEPDEFDAFSPRRMVLAEHVLEYVCKCFAQKHPRPPHVNQYLRDFKCPWDEHFTEGEVKWVVPPP
ncbi:hypothetical protein EPN42_07880 [bacterium]|nr:MAG: hypothetical protein EPN42_07880 [bacterium]